MWTKKFLEIFKHKDLRKKILFVFVMMVIFRAAASIPIPGIDAARLSAFFSRNQFFGLMNIFTGGALERLSVVMLGIGPYITAIIIMQLLTLVFPRLEELYKEEGEEGQRKFNQYARILTVPLAILQSFAMLKVLQGQKVIVGFTTFHLITSIITITAGAMFLMWIGELITEKGIGNGISLLIFAGIISGVPASIRQSAITWDPSQLPAWLAFIAVALIIMVGVVIINEARRNVPVSYAKRVRGHKMYGGVQTYLPMMVNPAGVMPIIFAMSIMLIPGMLGSAFKGSSITFLATVANFLNNLFQRQLVYGLSYFILVVLFTYFYTAVTFDPNNVSENLQKMGGFIPGIRPGENTANFLRHILNRVLFVGAIFLGIIAVMPSVVQGLTGISTFGFVLGGTSLLIIVAVVLETMAQIKGELEMRSYE
ncbi:MAG: preprotein translocase subunit SecY [Candidatus Pacebacteria bacterium]|nr:preprotein translocase subunit SecY [Candidatus Paceibacterota bacterium]